jgi:hypothetical protein
MDAAVLDAVKQQLGFDVGHDQFDAGGFTAQLFHFVGNVVGVNL